jgi:hypothetical protein
MRVGLFCRDFYRDCKYFKEELTMEKRRFSRFSIVEKCFVDFNNCSFDVNLRDISLNGALVEFKKAVPSRRGDELLLSYPLGYSDKYLQFDSEVVHTLDNMVGVKFIDTDLNTLVSLHQLLTARTDNPDQLKMELDFLIEDEK